MQDDISSNTDNVTNSLEEILAGIETQKTQLLTIGSEILQRGDGVVACDLLVIGAVKRSVNLISAFVSLVRARNIIVARALLRMQIDTAIRFAAITLVENLDDFANQVLSGTQINTLRARDGERLTDRYLVQNLKEIVPWLPDLYRTTSGYVHFSGDQIFASIAQTDDDTNTVYFLVTDSDERFPESTWIEVARRFQEITSVFMGLLGGYRDLSNGELEVDTE